MTAESKPFSPKNAAEIERLELALQAAAIGSWELDLTNNTVRWCERCKNLYGFSGDDLVPYQVVRSLIHADDRERMDEAIQRALDPQSGGQYDLEFRTVGAQGEPVRWLNAKGQAYFDEQRQPHRFLGIVQNVTQNRQARQQAESTAEQLRDSERQLRSLLENTPDIITRRDKDLRLIFANSAFERTAGVPVATLLGKTNLEMGQPAKIALPYMERLRAVLESGQPQDYYDVYPSSKGDVYFYSRLVPEPGPDGSAQSVLGIARDITALRTVERQRQEAAELLQLVLDSSMAGISVLTTVRNEQGAIVDFKYRLVNRVTEQTNKRTDLVGQLYSDVHSAYKQAGIFADFIEVVNTGQSIERDRHYVGEGFDNWFATVTAKIEDGVVFSFRDITPDVEARHQLEAGQRLFKNVTNSSPTGLWLSDAEGGLTYLNHTLVDWTGMPYEDLLGPGWANAIIEEDRQRSAEIFLNAVAARTHYDVLFRIKKGDGRVIWCRAAGDPYYHEDGTYAGYAGFCMDIDELVSGREALQQSEAKFRSVIATAPAAMSLFVGRDLIVEMPNQAFIDIVGKGPDIVGKPLREVMPELESQPFLQILDDVYTSGRMFQSFGTQVHIVQHGVMTHNFYNITYTPLLDADGKVFAILDIAIDVTEEIIARQKLEESELFSRSIIDSSPVAKVVFVGEDMEIRTVNENMLAMLGRDASIIGKPFMEVMPELIPTPLMDRLRHVFTTGETHYQPEEKIDLVRYGQPYTGYYNYIYKALHNTGGIIYGIMCTATEVTEQVVARQKVEESEKRFRTLSAELDRQVQIRTQELQASVQDLQRSNENLQQFAYIASHDLQEPLRKIQSFGDLLKNHYATELGEGVDHLQRMQTAASRMSTLIKDLLAFSRISIQQDTSTAVSLTQVLRTVVNDLELVIEETAAVVEIEPLPTVQGDPTQLSQLFQNLLSNALKFRRTGQSGTAVVPTVRVRAQSVAATELPPSVRPTRAAAAYHRIDVSDNGIGFDQKYVDRIFQVFQRLHGRSEYAGTGIGLAICEKVTANHGGAITATSQPGQGATFSVYLPA